MFTKEKDILNKIIQELCFGNKADFARSINISPQTITNWINRGISKDGMSAIQKAYPEISSDWLLTGEGEMLKPEAASPAKPELEEASAKDYLVPLIPTAALANSLSEYIGPGVRRIDCQNIISPVPGAEFAITISGDSMEPKFHDGMVVFLKRINDIAFIPWGNTLVLDTENGAFIKDVFPVQDNESMIEARSRNPIYPPLFIPKISIYGMYRVLNATKFFTTM